MKYLRVLLMGIMVLSFNSTFAQSGDGDTVYELRTYTTNEGKLDDLHARFRDHTIGLFNKHGIESVGYWTPNDTPNTLVYVIRHNSMAAAKKSWQDFGNDPAWKAVAISSTANGPILAVSPESVYMKATDYSLDMLK